MQELRFYSIFPAEVGVIKSQLNSYPTKQLYSILSFTPDVVFLVFLAVRLVYLWHQSNKLSSVGWIHLSAKLAVLGALLAANGALLKYTIRGTSDDEPFVWPAAPIVQFISSVRVVLCWESTAV